MAQIIKIKGSKTNASATPSSLVERELASNLVDRCLFGSDGTSVFKYYTGTTKYFDANGYANNANKLGGQSIDYFASADGVADALDEIIASLKGYQPLITSTNKLAYSLISGVPTSLKNPTALTFGTKTYDGSAARTILASDLGALTAHQTIYALTIKNSAGTTQLTYTPNSAVGSLTLTKAMVGLSNVENTALSTWVGTNKITTLGTITTGVWNGTKIANGYLANSAITIAGTSVSLGGSITAATLQSNLGLGSFAYKSSLAFADLTNKPTTISGYGITDAVSMPSTNLYYYDLNTKLTGNNAVIVPYFQRVGETSNSNNIGSARKGVIRLQGGGSETQLVFDHYDGTIYHRYYGNSTFSNWRTILHSENYTDYTYSKTQVDSALGGYLPLSGGTISGNLGIAGHFNVLSHYFFVKNNDYADWIVTDKNWQHEYNIIHSGNIGSQSVASATKLQTARTIWGQSFDGTENVVGSLISSTTKSNYEVNYTYYRTAAQFIASDLGVGEYIDILVGKSYGARNIAYIGYHQGANDSSTYLRLGLHSVDDVITINANGNVGVGTSEQAYKFHSVISDRSNWVVACFTNKLAHSGIAINSASGYNPFMRYQVNGVNKAEYGYSSSRDNFYIGAYNTDNGYLNINITSGNVGIGTTSPSQKLHVNGNILIDSGKSLFGSSAAIIASLNGSVELKCGNVNTNSVCLTSAKELRPFSEAADAIDLGSSSYRWKNIYGNNIDLKSSSANIITIRRSVVGGGALIDYHYSNLTDSQWRVGSGGDGKFMFNKFSGTTEVQIVTISADGVLFAKKGVWSDGYVSAKGQNTSSDIRLKNVLEDIRLSVSDIANAPSFKFAWKNGNGVDVGSSAQYWQGLLPDAVKERDGYLEMQYANIALVSAIAIAKNVETHEERIVRLEKENKELRNEINNLRYGA